jgi:hypothetical protein
MIGAVGVSMRAFVWYSWGVQEGAGPRPFDVSIAYLIEKMRLTR